MVLLRAECSTFMFCHKAFVTYLLVYYRSNSSKKVTP